MKVKHFRSSKYSENWIYLQDFLILKNLRFQNDPIWNHLRPCYFLEAVNGGHAAVFFLTKTWGN